MNKNQPNRTPQSMNHKYDAIINLPHHVSTRHAPMSSANRAAQFSPFAALTGHEEALAETARRTQKEVDDEITKETLY
jgi:hypothetical protein